MARPTSPIPKYLKQQEDNNGLLWIRMCPKCKQKICHRNLVSAKTCHKQKRLCYDCSRWNKGLTKENNISIRKLSYKVSKSMKKLRENINPWNKGLTKETNEILKYMGENHKGFQHTEKTKRVIGEHSKLLWDRGYWGGRHTDDWVRYLNKVRVLTRHNIKKIPNIDLNKRGKSGDRGAYQIDHIIPIKYGYDNNISEELISDISNLRFIPWEENRRKGKKYDGKGKIQGSNN